MSARAAAGLGAAQVIDAAVQMLLPMLLVRQLGAEDFGVYRALWLLALTASALWSFNVPGSLVYWLAQQPRARHGALLANVLAYLSVAGLASAALLLAGPAATALGALHTGLPVALPALFCALWIVSLPFDHIAIAAGEPGQQARLGLAQTALRLLLIGGAAVLAGLQGAALAMLLMAGLRAAAWWAYAARRFGASPLQVDAGLAAQQGRYALAFGLGASLWSLRAQADGWVAAAWLGVSGVAAISVAATVVPLIGMVRQAVVGATLARMAQAVHDGRLPDAAARVQRNNLATALAAFPMVGGFVAVAPDAIALLYTAAFYPAGDAARLFALTQLLLAVEVTPLVHALGHGRFVMASGGVLLALGVGAATLGALCFGLPGLALGALVATLGGCCANLWLLRRAHGLRAAQLMPVPLLWRLLLLTLVASALAGAAAATVSPGAATVGWAARLRPLGAGLIGFALLYAAGALATPAIRLAYLGLWQRLLPARHAATPTA